MEGRSVWLLIITVFQMLEVVVWVTTSAVPPYGNLTDAQVCFLKLETNFRAFTNMKQICQCKTLKSFYL